MFAEALRLDTLTAGVIGADLYQFGTGENGLLLDVVFTGEKFLFDSEGATGSSFLACAKAVSFWFIFVIAKAGTGHFLSAQGVVNLWAFGGEGRRNDEGCVAVGRAGRGSQGSSGTAGKGY